MDSTVALLSFILAICSFIYTTILNNRSKREQDALRNKANRLEVDSMYEKVRMRRVEFEEALRELSLVEISIQESDGQVSEDHTNGHKASLLRSMTKFSAFYNEIEAFCSRLVDKTISSEEYITKEVLPSLKKDALRQANFFGVLNNTAQALNMPPIPRPEPVTYRNYNIVIEQYFGHDTDWMNQLNQVRYDNSFTY